MPKKSPLQAAQDRRLAELAARPTPGAAAGWMPAPDGVSEVPKANDYPHPSLKPGDLDPDRPIDRGRLRWLAQRGNPVARQVLDEHDPRPETDHPTGAA